MDQSRPPPRRIVQDAVDGDGAEAGDAEEFEPLGAVDVDREPLGVALGPQGLRVGREREVAVGSPSGISSAVEAVLAQEPVGLVQAVLAGQEVLRADRPGPFAGQRRVAQAALVGAEVDAAKVQPPVEAEGGLDEVGIGLGRGARR